MTVQTAMHETTVSYTTPSTVEEALSLMQEHSGDCEFIAGGTDSELQRRAGLHRKPNVIDISGIGELRHLEISGNSLTIGASVTLHELTVAPEITIHFPIIAEAAASIATPVIRKTATIGGNLLVSNRCTFYNQSPFWRNSIGSCLRDVGSSCLVTSQRDGKCFSRSVSDLAPALIALNAEVFIRSPREEKRIPLGDLYVMDGLHPIRGLDEQSLITSIRIPRSAEAWGYRKLRLRKSLDFTSLTAAACLDQRGVFRICLNGIAMAPILIQGDMSETSLDETRRQLRLKSRIVNNDLLPIDYRREMLNTYVEDLWNDLKTPERKA